jgi:predicted methyltransferase
MNKERYNQIVDDAYKNFLMTSKKRVSKEILEKFLKHTPNIHKVEFIDKIKTDERFSERWGLKIEERDLSLNERVMIYGVEKINTTDTGYYEHSYAKLKVDEANIPTREISVTYKDEKLEIYE